MCSFLTCFFVLPQREMLHMQKPEHNSIAMYKWQDIKALNMPGQQLRMDLACLPNWQATRRRCAIYTYTYSI